MLNKKNRNINFEKEIKRIMTGFNNKVCWRCGRPFCHGFVKLCTKCEGEIHGKTSKNKDRS